MTPSKVLARLLPAVSVLALGLFWVPAQAERTPPRPLPLAADAATGRVIVKFKANASLARERILSDSGPSTAALAAQRLQTRATGLGNRHGFSLRSGRAIDERTQVMMAAGVPSAALAAQLAQDPEVEYAVVDARHRRLLVPNDPLYAPSPVPPSGPTVGQWYLKPPAVLADPRVLVTGNEAVAAINAQAAWDRTTGSSNVIVAVLDTGVRADHPDLAGKLVPGYDMITDPLLANDGNGRDADPSDPGDWISAADVATEDFADCEVTDSSWHGTMTAGLIGAATNNGVGMAGAGWNVRVLPVRVLGKCFGFESDIIAGMRWAAGLSIADPNVPVNANPAKVLNMSLGRSGDCSAAYADAILAIRTVGAVVVASAGNSTGHAVNVPARCSGVIGVAAVRHIGTKVGFSDVGPEMTIAAPGGNCVNIEAGQPCLFPILSTSNSGATTPGSSIYTDSFNISVGTSFSAPLVSATVALMITANPALTPDDVARVLRATARPFPQSGAPDDPDLGPIQTCQAPNGTDQLQCYCTTSTCGAGMLDAAAAVALAPTPPSPPAPPSDGGGGGALNPAWLLALWGAVAALRRAGRRD
jgi:serine protease